MELSEHLYNTLFASFRSNILPPQIELKIGYSSNSVLSIGSLVLYPKRINFRSGESKTSEGINATGYRSTKREAKSLKISICGSGKKVSDTIIVSLENNRFRQAHVLCAPDSSECGSDCEKCTKKNSKKVKFRHTYRKSYFNGVIGNKGPSNRTDIPTNNRKNIAKVAKFGITLYRIDKISHKTFKRRVKSPNSCIQEYVKNCKGKIKCKKCTIFTRDKLKIVNPNIISINTVVKTNINRPIDGLILKCELDLDGLILTSEHAISTNSSTFIPFYSSDYLECHNHPDEIDNENECCCTLKESLICSLHFKRILGEIQNILDCLYNGIGNSLKCRYMLYYHLQVLHFLQSRGLRHCNLHRIPDAILSINLGNNCKLNYKNDINDEKYLDQIFLDAKRLLKKKKFIRRIRTLSCDIKNYNGNDETNVGFHEILHALNVPHGLRCIYGQSDPFVSLDSKIFCNKMSDILIRYSDILSLKPGNISFMIEPEDFTFLRLLVNTPLYNVKLIDDVTRPDETENSRPNKAINGNISYKSINRLIWRYKGVLSRYPNTLSTFLRFVDYSDNLQVESLKTLLSCWKIQNVESLVELISCDFIVTYVRRYILDSVKSMFTVQHVNVYINQLVLALLYDVDDCLRNFLFKASLSSFELSLNLYWHLRCNSEREIEINYRRKFSECLLKYLEFLETESLSDVKRAIDRQNNFVGVLRNINKRLDNYGIDEGWKYFHTVVNDRHTNFELIGNNLEIKSGFPLFTHPNLTLKTLVPKKCRVLKSKRYPIVLHSNVAPTPNCTLCSSNIFQSSTFLFMYKFGDDLRQDQLCQQLISIINYTLKGHGIRTGLIPYKIMPISPNDGFIEFIPNSSTIFDIVNDWDSLENFLENGNLHSLDKKMHRIRYIRNFVDSLASLSVISYIFGIRDRHYHNILMTRDGFLVHVDFSYIFGADPTPLVQPPFKLSREFMGLLGGKESSLYKLFTKKFTCIFCILRSHSSEILNLLYASLSSKLPNLSLRAIVEVEMRFKLDLKRNSIEEFAQGIISESADSYSPLILDTWHKISSFFK
ncbi:phosphatidylinositol 4-kinase family protein [Theileria equi strain WA]|uniref:Phosphatidylinositol 4-kinase family protein n=1 Tax=Theileria equi strain WA TaxID=1537102 RepID=L0AZ20_THEEQ|nr:phosphatidylinositol 4-kinase family protein [Theileria equi strain WA]AFZ80837.1 phosphatidylinositol 4-kinase family protein [Theileria equi strain WA]|eukprot:XP_004830503.1 phosphatidylinositol 4-kinase family protein [Theileria equi strain WA]